jgi:hypothetical protein
MRRTWVLAVLVLAACGGAGDGAAQPVASSSSPVERRPRRVRALSHPETTAVDGEVAGKAPPDARAPVEPLAEGAARVVGRVVDARGDPVGGAEVVAFLGVSKVEGWAGRDGGFSLEINEPTGVARCLAWSEHHAITVGDWFALAAGDRVDINALRCADAAPISGSVTQPDGRAWSGCVCVDWTDAFDSETWELVRRCTDLDRAGTRQQWYAGPGQFEFPSLPSGRYRVRAAEDGDPRTVTAPASDVVLPPASPPAPTVFDIDLRVRDSGGSPVTEFAVETTSACARNSRGWRPHVDHEWVDSGGVRMLRVTCGDFRGVVVSASAADGSTARCELRGPPAGPVQLVLRRAETDSTPQPLLFEIRGRVTGAGGAIEWPTDEPPVEVVAVRDRDGEVRASTKTAADGSFLLGALEEGAYRVWATVKSDGHEPSLAAAWVSVSAGVADVLIDLPAARSRCLRLLLPEGLIRIDDDELCIDGPDLEREYVDLALTGRDLVAKGLRADVPYSLSVRVRCGTVWTATTRIESFTAGDDPIEIRLVPGLRVEGSVVRGDGSPVIGAYVYAEAPDGNYADAYTGLDGTFSLTGLEPGSWAIEVSAPGFAQHESVADAGTTGLRLVMQAER